MLPTMVHIAVDELCMPLGYISLSWQCVIHPSVVKQCNILGLLDDVIRSMALHHSCYLSEHPGWLRHTLRADLEVSAA